MVVVTLSCIGYELPYRRIRNKEDLTIGQIKRDLIRQNPSLQTFAAHDVHLSIPNYNESTLSDVVSVKSLLGNRRNWLIRWLLPPQRLELQVTTPKRSTNSHVQEVSLTKLDPVTPRVSKNYSAPQRLVDIFQLESQHVLDALVEYTRIDRDVLLRFYEQVVCEKRTASERAQAFFILLQETGFLIGQSQEPSSLSQTFDFNGMASGSEGMAIASAEFDVGRLDVVDDDQDYPASRRFTCPVCQENSPISDQFVGFCEAQHFICYDCVVQYLEAQVGSGKANISCYAHNCKHVMADIEIACALGNGNQHVGRKHPTYSAIDQLKLGSVMSVSVDETCTCPSEGCGWTAFRSSRGAIEKVTCGSCRTDFCSSCTLPYHYRTTCAELEHFRRDWREWESHGRAVYWQRSNRAKEKESHDRKQREAVTRAETEDERRKEQLCRHCPSCGRIVEKTGGCNAMVCGQNAHGGNQQYGCGRSFNWNQAKPYKAAAPVRRRAIDTTRKENTLHVGWSCDQCRKEIRGLRFECLSCPSFCLCELCDKKELEHTRIHIFRIHDGSS